MPVREPVLSDEKRSLYREGIDHWNEQRFFECHEVLEELWLQAGDERRYYQGLIQAAAGFYKVQLDSQGRGVSLLETAIEKLELYPGVYLGLDVQALVAELRDRLRVLRESLERREPLPAIAFPRLELKL